MKSSSQKVHVSVLQNTNYFNGLFVASESNLTDCFLDKSAHKMYHCRISCDKRGLNLEYLPHLRHSLTLPLVKEGGDGVPDVIKCLDEYNLIKEDFDSILEVSQWPNSENIMSMVESKVSI